MSHIRFSIERHTLHFINPATTSRGVYTDRALWIVSAVNDADPSYVGRGECAPLFDLSCDYNERYEDTLRDFCLSLSSGPVTLEELPDFVAAPGRLRDFPSMLFGIETAMLDLSNRCPAFFPTPFAAAEEGIPINGLVWMGSYEQMLARLEDKLKDGFKCVKLKIGAIDFDRELDLMDRIRRRFGPQEVELRLDANGAFPIPEAIDRLQALARYDVHSIEQPIRQGHWQDMARIVEHSPIPVALDEELIGVNDPARKAELLDCISPRYIVLKPTLHGGMAGVREWVALAESRGTGSWITSALESNIGLNAVAQLAADIYGPHITFPQGLGTGALFSDNFPMPIHMSGSEIWYGNPKA